MAERRLHEHFFWGIQLILLSAQLLAGFAFGLTTIAIWLGLLQLPFIVRLARKWRYVRWASVSTSVW